MQSGIHELVDIEQAITRLNSNDPQWNFFSLRRITMHTTPAPSYRAVSHIRDSDLARLAAALRDNTTVKYLELGGSSSQIFEWTAAGAQAFGEMIKDHPKIATIDVDFGRRTNFNIKNITSFLYCLTGSAKIEHLSVNVDCEKATPLTSSAAADGSYFLNTLGQLLQTRNSLKSVSIDATSLDEGEQELLPLSHFATGLGLQTKLEFLSISHLSLTNNRMTELAKALSKTTTLAKLYLAGCDIGHVEMISLCQILNSNRNLKYLNLTSNAPGEQGFASLINTLPLLTKLYRLELGSTRITKQAFNSLTECLRKHPLSISTLGLDSSQVVKNSCDAVVKLIDGNPILKKLNLNFCGIDDAFVRQIKPLLSDPNRCQLETFAFHGYQNSRRNETLNKDTCVSLIDILKNNHLLTLPTNLVPPKHIKQLEKVIAFNKTRKAPRERQAYINTAIAVANVACTQSTTKEMKFNLSSLAKENVVSILLFLGIGTPGMDPRQVYLCTKLIVTNFNIRRDLMDKGQYTPNANISLWWSQKNPQGKEIFKHAGQAVMFKPTEDESTATQTEQKSAFLNCRIM